MIPLFSTKTIRSVDEFAISKLKVPSIVLMENAALEIFKYAEEKLKSMGKSGKIGFICGKGNNGGDGFAVARHFVNHNYNVVVIYLFEQDEMTNDCRINFQILNKMLPSFKSLQMFKYEGLKSLNHLKSCYMIVDAMLGSGIQGELKEPYQSIVKQANKLQTVKLSIDIPTGLDSDKGYSKLMFNSDVTVTLGELKPGLFFGDGFTFAGEIKKGSIGISPSYYPENKSAEFLIELRDAKAGLPQKAKSIHKYSAGKVLTIAGSGKYSGAALLTAKSSMKVGAGASVLCFPKSVRNFVHRKSNEIVLNEYDDRGLEFLDTDAVEEISDKIKWADVVAIGPGLGRAEETQEAVTKILNERKFKKIVLDADALYTLRGKKYKKLNLDGCILTPHHGEFCGLLGIELAELHKDILSAGKNFVRKTGSYLILKGAPTIIFLPDGKALINTVGNPGMAKFGTGDVLTGVIAGLLAQSQEIKSTLIASVYIHSLAADLLIKNYSEYGFTASDVMNNLPSSIRYVSDSIV
ncbi:MAG: NAD(P)H-hydrate dehydratase [Ignavibacteriaceae bacterium]|nr:NAD(P)H-hydrate dehydratase [Ignavibacteriaceae bacterium]